ncbi:MAG: 2-phospho-L-lactate transferase [SAR202 cluster bacterium]|nr:2-phospho-L-lactate transferase [SAR202 cluster bacterium]
MPNLTSPSILALAGGVGGAKLALGLTRALPPDRLTIVVNTGDDDEFHGLHVSPDLDTVMYTLAGLNDTHRGWGLVNETWNSLAMLTLYNADDTWFNLGDKDFATHIRRTHLLRQGHTLSRITEDLCKRLGIKHAVAPMTDQPVRTLVDTNEGLLRFQEYFVKRHCEPAARAVQYKGAAKARPSSTFDAALKTAGVLVFCPSNPFLSVAPILALKGVRKRIEAFQARPEQGRRGKRIAVSPIVAGAAVKGPAAKMMAELGMPVNCVEVAKWYQGLCDIFIIDTADKAHAPAIQSLGMEPAVANTIMNTLDDKVALARFVLQLAHVD